MPELPEVETTRRGIAPHLVGRRIDRVIVRDRRLRWPIPEDFERRVRGLTVTAVGRRAKYLLVDCADAAGHAGWVIIHLGMSGSLRVVAPGAPVLPHDHVDLIAGDTVVRMRDPRRFGAMMWHQGAPERHALIGHLGLEPFDDAFTGAYLHRMAQRRDVAVKPFLMDHKVVVGVGNIYASEALYRAGLRPTLVARRVSAARCDRLAGEVRTVLGEAIEAGGSTLRDFVGGGGEPGYFQMRHAVYDREGEACARCGAIIRRIVQGQRSTFFCPDCQRR